MTARMNPYVKHFGLVKPLIDLAQDRPGLRPGRKSDEAGRDPGLADQRLRGLPGHALQGGAPGGETEERVLMLNAWRETTLYNEREKAALAWTEALTRLPEKGAPDEIYEAVQAQFSEKEQIALTLLVGVINSFNRIGVGFHVPPLAQQRKAA